MFGKSSDQSKNITFSNNSNNKSYGNGQLDQSGSKSSRVATMYQKNLQKLKSAASKTAPNNDYQNKSYNTKNLSRGGGGGVGFSNLSERSRIIKKNINKSLRPSQPGGDNHLNISMHTQQT